MNNKDCKIDRYLSHLKLFSKDLFYYMMQLPSMLIYADITLTQIWLDILP